MSERAVGMRWIGKCLLVDDPVPMDLFGRLSKLFPRGAIMDSHLARMAWSMNAMGMPYDTLKLSKSLEPAMRTHVAQRYAHLSQGTREWLAVGQHGASSVWLFKQLTGVCPEPVLSQAVNHPHDESDLRRVVDMLETVQGHDGLPEVANDASPHWTALASVWPSLMASLRQDDQDKQDGKALGGAHITRTRQLMNGVLGRVPR